MAKRCGSSRNSCGMRSGLFNPFFQNGKDIAGYGYSYSQGGVTPDTNALGQQVFGVFGDSKAAGNSDGVGPTPTLGTVFQWSKTPNTIIDVTNTDVLGATNGSWMPQFGISYNTLTGKKPILVPMGSPSSSFANDGDSNNWDTGTLYNLGKTELDLCLVAAGVTKPKGIIFICAINDAELTAGTTITQVKAAMDAVFTKLNTDYPDVPIYIFDAGTTSTNFKKDDIDRLLYNDYAGHVFYDGGTYGLGIVQRFNNVHQVYNYTRGYHAAGLTRADVVHWNVAGNNDIGAKIANYIVAGNERTYDYAPHLKGWELATDFSYVRLFIEHEVFKQNGNILTASDWLLTFAANGGTATNAVISSIEKENQSWTPNGMTVIKFNLTITGAVSGAETITITPVDVYDKDGNQYTDTTHRILLSNTLYAPYSLTDLSNTEQWGGTWIVENNATMGAQVLRCTSNTGGTKPNGGARGFLRLGNVPLNTKGVQIEFDYLFSATGTGGIGVMMRGDMETPFDLLPYAYAVVMICGGNYRTYRLNNMIIQNTVINNTVSGVPATANTVERLRLSILTESQDVKITVERVTAGPTYTKLYDAVSVTNTNQYSKGIGGIGFTDRYLSGSPTGRFGNIVLRKITALP